MCGVFGFADTQNRLTPKQRKRLTKALAVASEVRGTDAAGIAYVHKQEITVYKRPTKARKMNFYFPQAVNTVIGHTGLTTQGSEKKSYNNHPFIGSCGKTQFALTHNGVLENDIALQKEYCLPATLIETDSYVVIQMLQRYRELTIEAIAETVSLLKGTFTLVLLDSLGSLFLVKGNNPLCIFYYRELGLYIYATTKEILKTALYKTGVSNLLYEEISLGMGDILQIQKDGNIVHGKFDTALLETYYPYEMLYSPLLLCNETEEYLETLLCIASAKGYEEEQVMKLFKMGYSLDEMADIIYNHEHCLFTNELKPRKTTIWN